MRLKNKYAEDVEYNRLEVFALVLQYRIRRLPFFEGKHNKIRIYRSGNELLLEISISEFCFFRYVFSFATGDMEGKDWIVNKKDLTMFFNLSQKLGDFSDRLINVILYGEISHWLRGHNVERRAVSLIEKHINKKYKGDVRIGIQNKHKDYHLKYDLEIISKRKSFNPILIDIKSSAGAKHRAEEQILNGTRGKRVKVHILHVDDSDSDATIVEKFEEIRRSHLNGHLISI